MLIRVYVKFKVLIMNIRNIIKLLKFSLYLYKHNLFRDGNPRLVLRVLQGYLKLEACNYPDTVVSGRSVRGSVKLLSTLIDEYFENKSDKTLARILEILKVEFIKRSESRV